MISVLSFFEGIPANYILFPGAKFAGLFSHLSKFVLVHLSIVFYCNEEEYIKPSAVAILAS